MAAWAEWMGADPAKVYKELDRGRQGFPCLLFPEKVHAEGSIAYGAFCKEKLVAFSLLETRPLGEQYAYFNLLGLFVTRNVRGQGLGTQLFQKACRSTQAWSKAVVPLREPR